KRAVAGPSGRGSMEIFPEKLEPLYCPPWRFFSLLGGNFGFGGFGVNPLLLTLMEDWSNPVPFTFPTQGLPSARGTADGYWPVRMNPRIFDFPSSLIFAAAVPPRAFAESATTATALL